MFRLSWNGFRERWSLFTGAIVTVCLGVALVQSSLVLLLAAVTGDAPRGSSAIEIMTFDESTTVAITVLSMTLALSAFLAVFVISSTFAFTVAQRQRDLALLRLVGGSRGQVRRLLTGEAVLLGLTGTVIGIPLGVALTTFQERLLARLDLSPSGFDPSTPVWVFGASVGVGVGLALAGVLMAARRAARVQPLAALRSTGAARRSMTAGRWFVGIVALAGAGALVMLSPKGGASGGQAMAPCASICGAIALAMLAPVLVSPIAALLLLPFRGVLGRLASANVRDSVRRNASTAAPLIVLVGLVVGQASALSSFASSAKDELRAGTSADLVLESTRPLALDVSQVRRGAVRLHRDRRPDRPDTRIRRGPDDRARAAADRRPRGIRRGAPPRRVAGQASVQNRRGRSRRLGHVLRGHSRRADRGRGPRPASRRRQGDPDDRRRRCAARPGRSRAEVGAGRKPTPVRS